MYTSVICILKEQMCALLVLTEIWNNYIPKHVIYGLFVCLNFGGIWMVWMNTGRICERATLFQMKK